MTEVIPMRTAFPAVYIESEEDYDKILKRFAEGCCPKADLELNYEFQGCGQYEPVVWTDRPEGLPLFGLKWVGV